MTAIWLIRHGETAWSRAGRHTGTTDIPLTDRGRENAAAIAPPVALLDPGLVLCSPLHRAQDTARLAGLVPDATTSDLVEWDYGAWEGRTTAEIRDELGDPHWLIWDHPIPAGATAGEQTTDVGVRADRVIARCLPVLAEGHDCVLVAHGHVLRMLTARWLGLPAVDGRLFALDPARLSSLGFEHETHVITSWNSPSVAP
jgi:probable phosphoglycerate mutase